MTFGGGDVQGGATVIVGTCQIDTLETVTKARKVFVGSLKSSFAPLHRLQIAVLDGEEQLNKAFAFAFSHVSTWIAAPIVGM